MGSIIDLCQNNRQFLKWQGPLDQFLAAMPEEWHWDFFIYMDNAKDCIELFAITVDDQIVSGGMVFKGLPPEMKIFEREVEHYPENGYLYIGFLFVVPEYRGQDIGSTWLECIRALYGEKGFWLTVEEPGLVGFYEKNGFKWTSTLKRGPIIEELLILEPLKHMGVEKATC
ncbi:MULTISPECIES: GNAT family N-acetyltransferase [Maribacter]|nr:MULTISPECIES: GNAT family N-acetyltransferase [Maribacter]MDC6405733.1 GNAT family N-acetyltransferase [Maribacter sp. PR66]MEE1973015.1 GNAT family N-acetyltransferase [Maribacter flavus]